MDLFANAPVVSSYSRARAIEDGVLVDVSAIARFVGFTYPVAFGSAAFAEVTGFESDAATEEVTAFVRAVLRALHEAIRCSGGDADTILFEVNGRHGGARVALKSLVGPGDAGEPVITILFPNED